jgi:hypothetical protein
MPARHPYVVDLEDSIPVNAPSPRRSIESAVMQQWIGQQAGVEEAARAACDRSLEALRILHILHGVAARKAARERTGRDSIADN